MIERIVTLRRQFHDRSGPDVRRAQHPKHQGLCSGEFVVEPGLPDDLRVGLFSEARCSRRGSGSGTAGATTAHA